MAFVSTIIKGSNGIFSVAKANKALHHYLHYQAYVAILFLIGISTDSARPLVFIIAIKTDAARSAKAARGCFGALTVVHEDLMLSDV
jgi:hypothetical protein